MFFCNALLLNQIYLPTKFRVDISCSFRVMVWTRNLQRTNQPTDQPTADSSIPTKTVFVKGILESAGGQSVGKTNRLTNQPIADSSIPPKTLFVGGMINLMVITIRAILKHSHPSLGLSKKKHVSINQ